MANDHEELVALFRYSVISEAVGSALVTDRARPCRACARLAQLGEPGGRGALLLAQHARPVDRRLSP